MEDDYELAMNSLKDGYDEAMERQVSMRELPDYIASLRAELADARKKWLMSEAWRKAYQDGKGKMYSMGGAVTDAAMAHLPCNEAEVDRWFRAEYVHVDSVAALRAELTSATVDRDNCYDQLRAVMQALGGAAEPGVSIRFLMNTAAAAAQMRAELQAATERVSQLETAWAVERKLRRANLAELDSATERAEKAEADRDLAQAAFNESNEVHEWRKLKADIDALRTELALVKAQYNQLSYDHRVSQATVNRLRSELGEYE